MAKIWRIFGSQAITKLEKAAKLMDLMGLTESLKQHFQNLRQVSNLHVSGDEEKNVSDEFLGVFNARWPEDKLDQALVFFESDAGKIYLDRSIVEDAFKAFDVFLEEKIKKMPKPTPKFYVHGPDILQ